jgi:putative flippase GtrA
MSVAGVIYSDGFKIFCRFLIVGLIGTMLDFGLMIVLKSTGMNTLIANSVSFSTGTINNFILNRKWTFNFGRHPAWQGLLIQFTSVSLVGLFLNSLVVLALEAPLGNWLKQPEAGYLPAKAIATGLVLFWNYFANKCWTFKHKC